jgi:hypothetical protein
MKRMNETPRTAKRAAVHLVLDNPLKLFLWV